MVGSDGYLYQGRGWHWVGAHTRGHNTKGYGVGYVGNFSATLPDPDAIALVRDGLLPCAVRAGRLRHDYALRGHRQVVNTSCPGDSLFQEIRTWRGFQVGTGGGGLGGPSPPRWERVRCRDCPWVLLSFAVRTGLRGRCAGGVLVRTGAGPDGCCQVQILVRADGGLMGTTDTSRTPVQTDRRTAARTDTGAGGQPGDAPSRTLPQDVQRVLPGSHWPSAPCP